MKRRDSIRLMIGGIGYILFANSCNKDPAFDSHDHFALESDRAFETFYERLSAKKREKLYGTFLSIAQNNTIRKRIYITEKILERQPISNVFLQERFLSKICDEIHVSGYVKKTTTKKASHLHGDALVVEYRNEFYQIKIFEKTRIIRTPADQRTARNIRKTNYYISDQLDNLKLIDFFEQKHGRN